MKNIILKSTIRQPVRTLVFALLVGVSTFFLVSRITEYQIITDEIHRIGEHFRSIGYFTSARRESGILDGVEFIRDLDSPLIKFEDHNRYGFATLNDFRNISIGSNNISDKRASELRIRDRYVFFYGKLISIEGDFTGLSPHTVLTFQMDSIVAGYSEWFEPKQEITIYWRELDGGSLELRNEFFELEQRYFVHAAYSALSGVGTNRINILFPLHAPNTPPIWSIPAPEGASVDFSDPALAHLTDRINLLNINHSAMRVFTSIDLTAKPQTQRNAQMWVLQDGRWINHHDYLYESPVAVVHWDFAHTREISIGDTITLTLWDLAVRPPPTRYLAPYSWGIRSACRNWINATTEEIKVKIVGFFSYQHSAPTGSHHQDIWIPTSLVPDWFGERSHPTNLTYSFTLISPLYQDIFYEMYGDALSEIGGVFYSFMFLPHNAQHFWDAVDPIIQSLNFNLVLFTIVFILIVILITFLFFKLRIREVACLRAIGCSPRKLICQFLFTISIIWLPSIFICSWLAINHAHSVAMDTLTPLLDLADYKEANLLLEVGWFMRITTLAFAFILMVTLFAAIYVTTRPVLRMLQGEIAKKNKNNRQSTKEDLIDKATEYPLSVATPSSQSINTIANKMVNPKKTVQNIRKASQRNIVRRIGRSPMKSTLIAMVSFVFVFAFSWLQNLIDYNYNLIEYLWNNTIVVGHIQDLVPDRVPIHRNMEHIVTPRTVEALLDTGFISDIYLEMGYEFAYLIQPLPDGSFPDEVWNEWEYRDLFNPHRNRLFAVTNLDKLAQNNTDYRDMFGRRRRFTIYVGGAIYSQREITLEPLVITLDTEFDPLLFGYGITYNFDDIIPVILPYELKESLELELGETIFISHPFYQRIPEHPFIVPSRQPGGTTRWALVDPWILTGEIVGTYTGTIHQPFAHNAILLPHGITSAIRDALHSSFRSQAAAYSTVSFYVDTSRNRETETLREMLEIIVSRIGAGNVPLTFTLDDEQLIYVVGQLESNLSLLRLLQPVITIVSLMIAIGISVLVAFQNMKRTAVARVLGASNRTIRKEFMIEQSLVTLFGLILGLISFTFVIEGAHIDIRVFLFAGLYFIAMLIGSLVGSILINNRPPLDLLQIKE